MILYRGGIAMVSLIAKFKAKPGKVDLVVEEINLLAKETRKEKGCLTYIPHFVVDKPCEITIFEKYADEAEFDNHRGSPHFKSFVETGEELIEGPVEVIFLKEF
jgi:quinol monooxygenase YgiN